MDVHTMLLGCQDTLSTIERCHNGRRFNICTNTVTTLSQYWGIIWISVTINTVLFCNLKLYSMSCIGYVTVINLTVLLSANYYLQTIAGGFDDPCSAAWWGLSVIFHQLHAIFRQNVLVIITNDKKNVTCTSVTVT